GKQPRRTRRRHPGPAVRGRDHVRPAPPAGRRLGRRHRGVGRAVRRRGVLPSRRPVRAQPRAPVVAAAPPLQPSPGGRAVPACPGGRRGGPRGEPVLDRRGDRGRRGRRPAAQRHVAVVADDRRRPHDRAPAAARAARAARPAGGAPLRRPPRHVGHLLRGAVHPRHAVPPSGGGGADRRRALRARGAARTAVLAARPRRVRADGLRSRALPRLRPQPDRRHHRTGPRPAGQPPRLRQRRHRRARPGLRPWHRYAGGRRTVERPAARGAQGVGRARRRRCRHRRGRAGVRPCRDHRHRRRPHGLRAPVAAARPPPL
ncbi:MAG: Guanidinobutyrase, partial [uncultured Nocardioidaceae bacterium]